MKVAAKSVLMSVVLACPVASLAHNATYKFKTISYDSASTTLNDLNLSNVIVGFYENKTGAGCFVAAGKTKTALTDPSGKLTYCQSINKSGTIAGYYGYSPNYTGYIYANSTFTDVPVSAGRHIFPGIRHK